MKYFLNIESAILPEKIKNRIVRQHKLITEIENKLKENQIDSKELNRYRFIFKPLSIISDIESCINSKELTS